MEQCERITYVYDKNSKIEVISAGYSRKSYALHNHVNVYTIGIMMEGSVQVVTGKSKRVYQSGQIMAIPPYVPHSIMAMEPYSMVTICIDKRIIQKQEPNELEAQILKMIRSGGQYEISAQMQAQIRKRLQSFRQMQRDSVTGKNMIWEKLRQQLEIFPEKKINIEDMADMVFTSKYHFIRCFKQEIGLTPHQFQMQNRIRKAQKLLGKTDSMTKVAMDTGFCDQSHFIKQFEKIVGLTPTDYKKASSFYSAGKPDKRARSHDTN